MDLIDDIQIIEEIEALEGRERSAAVRRPRVLRNRVNFLNILDDLDFKSRFRLTKSAVDVIHTHIKEKISQKTTRYVILI